MGDGSPLTDEELKAIREREAGATPGPWKWRPTAESDPTIDHPYFTDWRLCGNPEALRVFAADCGTIQDAAFIASARSDIPALLDAIEATQRECAVQYVKGWNDGEADAERLRVELESEHRRAEAALGALRELRDAAKEALDDMTVSEDGTGGEWWPETEAKWDAALEAAEALLQAQS
jgi:hypothetical protein